MRRMSRRGLRSMPGESAGARLNTGLSFRSRAAAQGTRLSRLNRPAQVAGSE